MYIFEAAPLDLKKKYDSPWIFQGTLTDTVEERETLTNLKS